MNPTTRPPALGRLAGRFLLLLAFATAVSCGGGGVGSGGTGAPVAGSGAGTLTGFGSVLVDGLAYDDAAAPALIEAAPGATAGATPRLGQFVLFGFDGDAGQERALALRLDAAVVGRVEAVDAAQGQLTLLGQTVVENRAAEAGPVTFYAGTGGLTDLAVGDAVEVHGLPRWNAALARDELLATRIERLAVAPALSRVAGIVRDEAAGPAGRRLRLGALTVDYRPQDVLPAGAQPSDGDRVLVWLAAAPGGGVVQAQGLRITLRPEPQAAERVRLGGSVAALDTAARRFELAGVPVRYGAALVVPQGPLFTLAEGSYVQVDGRYAADGSLDARQVLIRRRGAPGYVEVELSGTIEAFAGVADFRVRGTPVDASGVAPTGCGQAPLADGLPVRVEGSIRGGLGGSVVAVESWRCVGR